MSTDPMHSRANDSSDDWGSSEERPSAPLTYGPAYLRDRYFCRVVACSLAGIAGVALLDSIGLAAFGKEFPEFVVAIGSTAVGALASVLLVDRR